jgi:hypothetical protein
VEMLGQTASEIIVRLDSVEASLANDAVWTTELANISSGDIYVNDLPFGTYFVATYPESRQPANFIINALAANGAPELSLCFAYDFGKPNSLRQLEASDSPWKEDGVTVGPIPKKEERSHWTKSVQIEKVAEKLLWLEPNLLNATNA